MSVASVRPTFSFATELSADEIMDCIRNAVTDSSGLYRGQFVERHAMISIDESRRRFWSPWLHVEVREDESGRELFGRFSPHPAIWTGFMFSWLSIAVLVFFAAMFGISQQLAAQTPWGYYVIPPLLLAAGLLWIASQAGKRLAWDEMREMHDVFANCGTDEPEKVSE